MSLPELLASLRRQLGAHVDTAYRAGARNFFRDTVQLWGVRAPQVRKIARAAWHEARTWPPVEWNRLTEALWQAGTLEEGSIAIELCRRRRRDFTSADFRRFERWIGRYVRNWAHCDGVASWLLAACIENQPRLMERLPAWTRSRNRWKRRAAAVAFLQEAKRGRHTEAIFDLAGRLLGDSDDMVQKGVGWLLKETYPKRPRELMAFLAPRTASTSRLLLRYAAEKMTPGDRAALLARGRARDTDAAGGGPLDRL